jgi:hypothetical protein
MSAMRCEASSRVMAAISSGSEIPRLITMPPSPKPLVRFSQPKQTSRKSALDGRAVMTASQVCAIIFGEPVVMPP